jgi:hypothetical protein
VHQLLNRIQGAQLHLPARIGDARDANDDSDFDDKENRTMLSPLSSVQIQSATGRHSTSATTTCATLYAATRYIYIRPWNIAVYYRKPFTRAHRCIKHNYRRRGQDHAKAYYTKERYSQLYRLADDGLSKSQERSRRRREPGDKGSV